MKSTARVLLLLLSLASVGQADDSFHRHMADGRVAFSFGNFGRAYRHFEAAAEKVNGADSALASAYKVSCLRKLGLPVQAGRILSEINSMGSSGFSAELRSRIALEKLFLEKGLQNRREVLRGLSHIDESELPGELVDALNSQRGRLYSDEGRYQLAHKTLNRLSGRSRPLGLIAKAKVLSMQGSFGAAVSMVERARRLVEEQRPKILNDKVTNARLAETWRLESAVRLEWASEILGNSRPATSGFRSLGRQGSSIDSDCVYETTSRNVTWSFLAPVEQLNLAERAIKKEIVIRRRLGDVSGEIAAWDRLVSIDLQRGHLEEAKLSFKVADRLRSSHYSNLNKARSYLEFGAAIIENDPENERHLRIGVSNAELLVSEIDQGSLSDGVGKLIGSLLRKEEVEEARELLRRSRLMAFRAWFATRSFDPKFGASNDHALSIVTEIERLERQLASLKSEPKKDWSLERRVVAEKLAGQIGRFQQDLLSRDSQLAALAGRGWVKTATRVVEQPIASDEVLLEYFFSKDSSYVFASRQGYEPIYAEIDEKPEKIGRLIGRVRLTRSDKSRIRKRLYDLLIRPVEAYIREKDTLVIVPHGIAHRVPFGALMPNGQNSLVEEHPVVFRTPCIWARSHPSESLPIQSVGIANPELKYAVQEIEKSFAHLPGVKKVKLLDHSGTRAALMEILAAPARAKLVIHLATHGTFDADDPYSASLTFATLGTQGLRDSRLTALDVYQSEFKLGPETMVIMSACDSGRGGEFAGEEVASLAGAFLVKGGNAVISTLWKVKDDAMSELMTRFYLEKFHNPDVKSSEEALRRAQQYLRSQPRFSHPYYWAGVVLTKPTPR